MSKLCDYGCGKEAKYQFKNGRWCCSKSHNTCSANKQKNREKKIGKLNPFYGKTHSKEQKEIWRNNMLGVTLENRFGKEKAKDILYKMKTVQLGEKHPMWKKHHTKESKKKISIANQGKKVSEDTKNKLRIALRGRVFSEETIQKMKISHLGKKVSEETKVKISKTSLGRIQSEETKMKISVAQLGKKVSEETKKNQRLAAIKRIKDRYGQATPNYNPEACKLIDEYGNEHGYNFQHAENGGEFLVKGLGYYLDGYDKVKNVAIEVDEEHHFDYNGILRKRDVRRQKEIEKHLECEFIRLKI